MMIGVITESECSHAKSPLSGLAPDTTTALPFDGAAKLRSPHDDGHDAAVVLLDMEGEDAFGILRATRLVERHGAGHDNAAHARRSRSARTFASAAVTSVATD
ncbi:MAG: hypothetical protein KY432_09490, partial [Acidobacteria bacterium]|nr:hypothetical protein [Acidobacteriota bacterium]